MQHRPQTAVGENCHTAQKARHDSGELSGLLFCFCSSVCNNKPSATATARHATYSYNSLLPFAKTTKEPVASKRSIQDQDDTVVGQGSVGGHGQHAGGLRPGVWEAMGGCASGGQLGPNQETQELRVGNKLPCGTQAARDQDNVGTRVFHFV